MRQSTISEIVISVGMPNIWSWSIGNLILKTMFVVVDFWRQCYIKEFYSGIWGSVLYICSWVIIIRIVSMSFGFPGGSVVKNPPANAATKGDAGSIPGSGRYPGGRNSNPLQYFCQDNPMDRGAWRATVRGITNSWAQPSNWACVHTSISLVLTVHLVCFQEHDLLLISTLWSGDYCSYNIPWKINTFIVSSQRKMIPFSSWSKRFGKS